MVIIRLSRGGAKKRPFYHLVVTDSRNKRDGRYLERLGYFNPIAAGAEIRLHINMDRVVHWQSVGAQLSDRVSGLIKDYKKTGSQAANMIEKPAKKVAKAAAPTETVAAEASVAESKAEEIVAEPSTSEAEKAED